MIRVTDLRKSYGATEAVRGISFDVHPGEVLGLVGPNGAGKTTTLRCLSGILPPTSGSVNIAGHDLKLDPVGAKSKLAWIPDDPRLFENLTVEEHLRFIGRLYRVEDAEQRIPRLLDEFELAGKAGELPGALSRGMKQKLSIACAFIHRPKVILFDEPLTGLDPLAIRRAKDSIVRQAEEGASIIVSSHLLALVEEIAHRVLVIMEGTKAAHGTMEELKAAHPDLEAGARLEEIFLRMAGERRNGAAPPAPPPPPRAPPPPLWGGGGAGSHFPPPGGAPPHGPPPPAPARPAGAPPPVNPALLYLVRRSMFNALRERLKRLRSPRYFIPFLVGLAYFALVFGAGSFGDHPTPDPGSRGGDRDDAPVLLIEWGGALGVLLLATLSWILPSKGPPLPFLESDVAMLFPAPLRRRELVWYKLLDLQKYFVPSVVFLSLFLGLRNGWQGMVRYQVGGLLVFNLMTFYGVAVKLTRQSLLDHGVAGWKRTAPVLGLLAAVAAAGWLGAPPFPELQGEEGMREGIEGWLAAFSRSPAGWALLPFRLPFRMFLAPDLGSFLLHALPVLLLLLALAAWITVSDAAFEESAAEFATKLSSRIEAARKGKLGRTVEPGQKVRRSPFRLAPAGPPETAFVWRSLTETLRHVSPRFLIVLAVLAAVLLPIAADMGRTSKGVPLGAAVISVVSIGLSVMLVIGGPTLLGCSLRNDLEMAEVLKSLPVPGPRLFRSYLASAVAPSALLGLALALVAAATFPATPKVPVTAAWRIAGFLSISLVLPALMALSALVDAGASLLFPGWVRPGEGSQRGMETMGTNIVTMLAKMLLLLVGGGIPLGLGALLAAAVFALGGELLLPAGVMAGALLAAAGMLVEVWIASEMLGSRFDALDPSAEGLLSV